MEKNEQLFYDKLKDIFIGAKIEGNSGFVNLMKIKSSYFDVVFKELKKEIDEKLKEFLDFKEEMYDKLNTFFSTYFSESGSIYFTYTPLKSKIYDKIYTDQDDVILFWKTRMLYYVKTDKIWNNLTVEYDKDGVKYRILFDVSKLEHKSGNEKKEIIYQLNDIKNNEISFYVLYSEKGKETDLNDIRKKLKENKIYLDEEDIEKIFKIFEKQNEVDYFINKDAKSFLREQFDLWLKNYVFDDESDFSEKRIKELKTLKEIAYKIIDFVSQFEDELVKIWNKPKFVLNSNYVITLDRIANKNNGIEIIKKILNHKEIDEQIKEWKDLGIIDDSFDKKAIIRKTINGETLNPKYKFLPIDTKYFKDLELDILSLFDNLDKELDGWLIHSENYQALNTILPKFKEKVQTIYIDPPFNTGNDFNYVDRFQDSSWLALMENRVRIAKQFLNKIGSFYLQLDSNADFYGEFLLNDIFGKDNFKVKITWKRHTGPKTQSLHFPNVSDFILVYSNNKEKWIYNPQYLPYKKRYLEKMYKYEDEKGKYRIHDLYATGEGPARIFNGKKIEPPKGHHWIYTQDKIDEMIKEGTIFFDNRGFPKLKVYLGEGEQVTNIWTDINVIQGSSTEFLNFQTQKPEKLIERIIFASSNENDLILDFFLGSGTTTAVAHKLKRKWLGVEMGEHFYTIALPRMKKVLVYDKSGISKEEDVQKKYNENNAGGFFKYYDLEQYEQTLRRCHYIPSEPFFDLDDKAIYEQYIFLKDPKLLDAMELDYKNNKIKINFDEIYSNIDIAETLSNLKGKWIKKITKDSVILLDDNGNEEEIKYDSIDFKTIKPLIWW